MVLKLLLAIMVVNGMDVPDSPPSYADEDASRWLGGGAMYEDVFAPGVGDHTSNEAPTYQNVAAPTKAEPIEPTHSKSWQERANERAKEQAKERAKWRNFYGICPEDVEDKRRRLARPTGLGRIRTLADDGTWIEGRLSDPTPATRSDASTASGSGDESTPPRSSSDEGLGELSHDDIVDRMTGMPEEFLNTKREFKNPEPIAEDKPERDAQAPVAEPIDNDVISAWYEEKAKLLSHPDFDTARLDDMVLTTPRDREVWNAAGGGGPYTLMRRLREAEQKLREAEGWRWVGNILTPPEDQPLSIPATPQAIDAAPESSIINPLGDWHYEENFAAPPSYDFLGRSDAGKDLSMPSFKNDNSTKCVDSHFAKQAARFVPRRWHCENGRWVSQ